MAIEKIKVNLKTAEMDYKNMCRGDIVIVNRIPYELKEEFATQLVDMTLGTDDQLGVCYTLAFYELIENYLFAKYYTNIDVTELIELADFRALYDFMQIHDSYLHNNEVWDFVKDDLNIVHSIEDRYFNSIATLYESEHSLGNIVKELLKTDPDTNNEETTAQIEKLIDMKGALLEQQEQSKVLDFGKKKTASVKTGGVHVNLAKR